MNHARSGRAQLFAMSAAAIGATSFCFVLRALVIDDWGREFALSETQKGELLGVGLWPFAITIVLMSLVIDRIGFRAAFFIAAAAHAGGLALLLMGHGYWGLYAGTFTMALGNGVVEAAANPLVATLFAENKPRWLNRVHAAWPGGMIVGGLAALALGPAVYWKTKVALMAAPILVYGALLLRCRFPVSERVAAGASYRAMLAEAGFISAAVILSLVMLELGRVAGLPSLLTIALIGGATALYAFYARSAGRPLFIILLLLMIPLATTELSTDSWISSLMAPEMARAGLQAGWVLIYTSLIVFVVRIFAGSVIAVLQPLGVLALASAAAAVGLFLLADASGAALLAAATLYAIGKSFFWGTSLAVVSERFPRGGALAINVVAASGMLAAGIFGSVVLGAAQERATGRTLADYDATHGTTLARQYLTQDKIGIFGRYRAIDQAGLERAPVSDRAVVTGVLEASKKVALRDVALLPVAMLLSYGGLILFFRRRGGYRPVTLTPLGAPAQ